MDNVPSIHDQWKTEYCSSKGLQKLAEFKRTSEWFLLHKCYVISTVAATSLDKDASSCTNDEFQWLITSTDMHLNSNVFQIDFTYAERNGNELLKMQKMFLWRFVRLMATAPQEQKWILYLL